MKDKSIEVCILGGGFGGLYTALSLSNFALVKSGICQLTLVEPKDNFLFSPLLYELLTGELQPWEIAPSYQKLLAGKKINFCQNAVTELDFSSRSVKLLSGQFLSYDYLVLAVGNKTRMADIPGLKEHGLSFRSLADLDRLQTQLTILETSERRKLNIAVIGGGANGVELACKLHDRLRGRVQLKLIERGGEILKGFSLGVKNAAKKAIQVRSIEVFLKTDIQAIKADKITIVRNHEIIDLPVDLVLWTAGTESIDWVGNLPCQQTSQGKLLTRPTLQLIDYPEVFALGDLADIRNSKTEFVPATAQAAYQQASYAAKNIKRSILGKPLRRFRYLHLGDMLTLGKGAAIVSSFVLNIEGSLAAWIRRLVYIQRLPTFRHRLQVLKKLVRR